MSILKINYKLHIENNVSWTLFAWRLSRPRMSRYQMPCSIRIHAQCDVEEQRFLL